jgi:hypothetical protein
MPSDEPSRPYNWRPKSLAKLKFHNLSSFVSCYYIYLKTTEILQKSPGFLAWTSMIYVLFSVNKYIVLLFYFWKVMVIELVVGVVPVE